MGPVGSARPPYCPGMLVHWWTLGYGAEQTPSSDFRRKWAAEAEFLGKAYEALQGTQNCFPTPSQSLLPPFPHQMKKMKCFILTFSKFKASWIFISKRHFKFHIQFSAFPSKETTTGNLSKIWNCSQCPATYSYLDSASKPKPIISCLHNVDQCLQRTSSASKHCASVKELRWPI